MTVHCPWSRTELWGIIPSINHVKLVSEVKKLITKSPNLNNMPERKQGIHPISSILS